MNKTISIKKGKHLLPIVCVGFGCDHNQEPITRIHGLPYYQFFYCKKGMGNITVDGQQMPVKEGQFFVLRPNENHSYHGLTENWILDYVMLSGPSLESIMVTLGILESSVYNLGDDATFNNFLDYLKKYEQSPKESKKNNLGQLTKESYNFLIDLITNSNRINNRRYASQNDYVITAIEYMENHFSEEISLYDLSQEVGLSKEYLCSIFKAEMNISIVKFLNNMRIGYSKMYLKEFPTTTVSEIGKKCGFQNRSYFGKIFKDIVGVSPEIYRKS